MIVVSDVVGARDALVNKVVARGMGFDGRRDV